MIHTITDEPVTPRPRGGLREMGFVLLASSALTVLVTSPLAFKLGRVGRVENGDGQFSIWNVAWVARTLIVDPLHVFDANIFYPHRWTLAYSESNIGAGVLAVPAYWATYNPYFAHNFVVLLAFISSATAMYYLVRYLVRDRRAAVISAICFAFCPYVLAHTAHIQLLMTAGLPLSMLAFHRFADRPTLGRGAALGLAMTTQAACCGYYGIFAVLTVAFGVLVVAAMRGRWIETHYWTGLGVGAVVALVTVTPFLLPYLLLQRASGFTRPLAASIPYSANLSDYLASSSYAHAWMLTMIPPWRDVLFPGFAATVLGITGGWTCLRSPRDPTGTRYREIGALYGGLALLAFWASFGPRADLYAVLYRVVPAFDWLRAPSRFGLLVALGLSVLTGVAVSVSIQRVTRATLLVVLVAIGVTAELITPLPLREVPSVENAYRLLATLPRGPVIEMPFFYPAVGLFQHTKYMLNSTAHWMPLINGYSDYIPPDFTDHVMTLAPFPSRDAFHVLEPNHVRYAVFHMRWYNNANRTDVLARLDQFAPYLRPLYVDEDIRLFEIVGYPP